MILPETSQVTLKNTVELKIVNEVGSSSNSRPLTPPSLDIVEEELAKLGRETDVDDVDGDVDDVIGSSSQKLLSGNDDDDFDEDDLVCSISRFRPHFCLTNYWPWLQHIFWNFNKFFVGLKLVKALTGPFWLLYYGKVAFGEIMPLL